MAMGSVAVTFFPIDGTAAEETVTVFCAPARRDLAMAGARDSTQDVTEAVRDEEAIELAESPGSADILVVVFGRESFSYASKNYNVVYAILHAAEQTIPVQGISSGHWRSAADSIANKIEDIATTNYERLISERDARNSGTASPARDAEQTEVRRGMSRADVRSVLGDATRQVKFESTTLWDYGTVQVIFRDGEVVNVKF